MSGNQRIDLYFLCWNDARVLPFFFRHYDAFVDRYFAYDNGSTDATLDILRHHPKVTLRHFDVTGDSFVDEERRISDEFWKGSRNQADWVIVTDVDEHIYHPDLLAYLEQSKKQGVTAIRSIGYEMVADALPPQDTVLLQEVTRGCRSDGHDRLCIFDPVAVHETRFGPGRHRAWPEGHLVWPLFPEILLLHFKQMGPAYLCERSAELLQGIKSGDIANGWGTQYTWHADQIIAYWQNMKNQATAVPGLGELSHIPPSEYRGDERLLEATGLLDEDWYLMTYQDIQAKRAEPLPHFCYYGWKEWRWPNPYFDTKWYLDTYPKAREAGGNPVLHYADFGETQGYNPSAEFDATWYRQRYEVPAHESALLHFLERRFSGKFSPRPDFDVEAFCLQHPEVLGDGLDPFDEYLRRTRPLPVETGPEFPVYKEIADILGFGGMPDVFPANVPWTRFMQVVQLFLKRYPIDEKHYLQCHPDVAEAVKKGDIRSARAHFIDHGYFEGRSFRESKQA